MPPKKTSTLKRDEVIEDEIPVSHKQREVSLKKKVTKKDEIIDDEEIIDDAPKKPAPKRRSILKKNEEIIDDDDEEIIDDKPKPKPKPQAKRTTKRQVKLNETIEDDDTTMLTNDSKISKMYQKMKHREHVLQRPDTYVGKTRLDEMETYVYEDGEMVKKEINYVPALFKIFDEGLVNMRDHVERMREKKRKQELLKKGYKIDDDTIDVDDVFREVKSIKVEIDPEEGTITMENDGNGIDVVKHEEEGIYIPQMIFFELLSGTNFNDKEERTWGGRNGYGSKLISIFSKECTIETVDAVRRLKYRQTCRDNMSVIDEPVIEKCRTVPYTRLTFKPDLKIFGMKRLDDHDHLVLMHKRVLDIAACTSKTVAVTYNGQKVEIRDFEKYIDLYLGSKKEVKRVKLQPNDRWEVYVGISPTEKFEQTSFVNGVATTRGGKHVDHVATILANQLCTSIKEKKKAALKDLKPQIVKNCLWVFVNSTIINPEFDNQMKDCLTTPSKSFGSKFELGEEDVSKLIKLGLVESCIQLLTEKRDKNLEKIGGGKKSRIKDEKSIVAKYAGTAKASDCILILTEGDSAKTIAISGLAALEEEQRYYIGIMPLSGKIINVKKVTTDRIAANKEYTRIINMMGLKAGMKDFSKLNYGHIAVMTDADHDGYHIKALLFNMFHRFWPGLLKKPKFFLSIRTPIVSITKKTNKKDHQYMYSYVEFDEWKEANKGSTSQYEYVYYKGLGTHSPEEARDIFSNLQYIDYVWDNDLSYKWLDFIDNNPLAQEIIDDDENPEEIIEDAEEEVKKKGIKVKEEEEEETRDDKTPNSTCTTATDYSKIRPVENVFRNKKDYCEQSFKLAFEDKDKMADHRKDWLFKYILKKAEKKVDYSFQKEDSVNYFDFINSEFIEFSVEDCYRSIPNLMDGLKPSQRKIMYCCLKRNLKKKIKVEQLGGHISEKTNYHHGATSLYEAIVLLAQDYVGSNNINLLVPEGQFGTRVQNGDDHASARYVFTLLNSITDTIFDRQDQPLLNYIHDEGKVWEPEYYLPVIPLILINGARGIGTGWSTDVPSHNIEDIMANIQRYLNDEEMEPMTPFHRGFQGKIEKISAHRYKVTGCYQRDDLNDVVTITELPVGTKNSQSFEDYKNYLESLMEPPNEKDTITKKKKKEKLNELLKDVEIHYTDVTIDAKVIFKKDQLAELDDKELEKLLNLSFNITTSNMNLYTPDNVLKHYNDSTEILEDFLVHRMKMYQVRRDYLLKKLLEECETLSEKARFIRLEIDEEDDFTVRKKKREEAIELLKEHDFKTTDEIQGKSKDNNNNNNNNEDSDDSESDDEDKKQRQKGDQFGGYGYLVKMPILNQTVEMIAKLDAEREAKLKEIDILKETSTTTMYQTDLAKFQSCYDKFEAQWKAKTSYAMIYDPAKRSGGAKKPRAKRAVRNKLKP